MDKAGHGGGNPILAADRKDGVNKAESRQHRQRYTTSGLPMFSMFSIYRKGTHSVDPPPRKLVWFVFANPCTVASSIDTTKDQFTTACCRILSCCCVDRRKQTFCDAISIYICFHTRVRVCVCVVDVNVVKNHILTVRGLDTDISLSQDFIATYCTFFDEPIKYPHQNACLYRYAGHALVYFTKTSIGPTS